MKSSKKMSLILLGVAGFLFATSAGINSGLVGALAVAGIFVLGASVVILFDNLNL